MKKILSVFAMLVFICVMAIGCSTKDKDTAEEIIEVATEVIDTGAKIASVAGVPFAETVAVAVGFLSTTILALIGRGSEMKKKEALYQSTAAIHKKANLIADGLKDNSVSAMDAVAMLPTMVKDVSEVSHSAYNVYEKIEEDVNKYQKKGKLQKLV